MDIGLQDLDLFRSFVSVVDAGGFTRAGERAHRTQSTVTQQIRRHDICAHSGPPLNNKPTGAPRSRPRAVVRNVQKTAGS